MGIDSTEATAKPGSNKDEHNYEPINLKNEVLKAGEDKKEYKIVIHDNENWNPDLCFKVELFDCKSGLKLEGEDCQTKVTIIDEDEKPKVSFKDINIKVVRDAKEDKKVQIKIVRLEGVN